MEKQQIAGGCLLLAVTAAGFGGITLLSGGPETAGGPSDAYAELLAAAPVAEVEGKALSPNGRFEVRTAGESGAYVSGYVIPEALQIVDTETGEILWQDQGYLWQSARWSPGNNLVAVAYGGRTWTQVRVISAASWTSWEFALPDGAPIPEYVFLPEDWGTWLDMDTLLLTVGRGGDAGEARTYRCTVRTNQDGTLSGSALEQTTEVLPERYDFDHDGRPETAEVVTVLTPETPYFPAWYELRVSETNGMALWQQDAMPAHAGWTSLFALDIGGADYLLRYNPYMGQGYCTCAYEIFSLDEAGEEQVLRENRVEFDINFGSPSHTGFDAAAIAAFLEEVHGYLAESTLLLSTDGGAFRTGGSGADFRESDLRVLWDEARPYDASKSLAENLQNYADTMAALRTA